MNPFDYRTRLTALQKERDDARQRLDFWLKNETWESVAGCATHLQVLDAKMLIYESLQQNADATT